MLGVSLFILFVSTHQSLPFFFFFPVPLTKMSYKLFNPNVHPAVIGNWYTIATS